MTRTLVALAALLGTGCITKKIDRFTTQRVVPTALRTGDIDRTCKIGESLGHPLNAVTNRTPNRAMVIADATAAICDEARSWEDRVDAEVAQHVVPIGPGRIAAVKDARARARRHRQRAALRFHSAWTRTNDAFGVLGEAQACPRITSDDELTLLVGLVSGTLAMIHDKASGSRYQVPLNTLSRAGRVAPCLDDETWWHVPTALQAAAWIVVPGSGPEGIDPWEQLESAAKTGDDSGVRLGWALYAELAGNSGEDARVEKALEAAAASFASVPSHPDYAMLDTYAREILLHESDMLWAHQHGHRTPEFGELPSAPAQQPPETPFGDDPFGDPFATEPPADDPSEDTP